jgi:CRISPR-associated endoribonuclease Cas6
MQFASPTAFSLSARNFALFPEPIFVWDSLLRTWNLYAPAVLRIEKAPLREFVQQHVRVNDYTLHTVTLHYPKYTQKGFVGRCTYYVKDPMRVSDGHKEEQSCARQLAVLAEFARYAGVGYKTTMGMGQARLIETGVEEPTIVREAQV